MMSSTAPSLESFLPRFGLEHFRPGQEAVVEAVASGQDVMCVMPTGGGKSLCYQLPSLARKGTTIVVSPLIALMKDQVDSLRQLKINARLINSTLHPREQEDVMEEMVQGNLDLIYVAPERLRNGRFLEMVAKSEISLLAVDEAHCVSEWGHDFRPDYSRLGMVRKRYLGNLQTIALTATATRAVREDIVSLLELESPKVFVTGFARTNLRFGVTQCSSDAEKDEQLAQFIKQQDGAGIVYAATRKTCESLGTQLAESTRQRIGVYHGGMDGEQRRQVQEKFMSGDLAAIVATNAFGMGIDKSDIRYVAHYNIPGTLEAYYQEAGRAGRDGLDSRCRLFFSYQDRYIQEFFIENRYPSKETVQEVYQFLLARKEDPIELTLDQVREAIKADSSEAVGTSESLLAKAGVLRRLDSSQNQLLVRIDSDSPSLLDFLPKESKLRRRVMSAVESFVGGRRFDDVFVRPDRLMDAAKVERNQLMRTLRELSKLKSFDYVPPFRGRAIHFLRRDLSFEELEIDFDELARRKASEYEKLEAVIGFARTGGCRQRVILDYFGDPESKNCMKCDRCDVAGESSGAPTAFNSLSESESKAFLCGLRVVLSGITRMHGRFGKTLVAQMLCGSTNKKITQWRLQRLSTYGMLSNLKQSQLSKIIDQLIDFGLVQQREVDQRRPTIEITSFGREVMHLKAPIPSSFELSKPLARALAAAASEIESTDVASDEDGKASTESSSKAASESPGDGDGESVANVSLEDLTSKEDQARSELVDSLKRWRRRTSAALGIPAFRVLSNSTIDRLSEVRPTTSSELEEVPGIGPATMEQHGYDILELIREETSEQTKPENSTLDDEVPGADSPDKDGLPPHDLDSDDMVATFSPANPENAVYACAVPHANVTRQPDSLGSQEDEAYWTWRLFSEGFSFDEVCRIRRLSTQHVRLHLAEAQRAGRSVSPTWTQGN
ncbi:MAG: RecQ family ATP-dependent DNA helicase [Planctomycetota bacterium]